MSDTALNLPAVLWEERRVLSGRQLRFAPRGRTRIQSGRKAPMTLRKSTAQLNEDNRWALCLSGGGIRSAAFALGILQRFAAQQITSKRADANGPALQQLEYLSAVWAAATSAVGCHAGCCRRARYVVERAARMPSWRPLTAEPAIMRKSSPSPICGATATTSLQALGDLARPVEWHRRHLPQFDFELDTSRPTNAVFGAVHLGSGLRLPRGPQNQ